MASSPTQRTINYMRRQGFAAAVVEKWIPQTRRRADLFGGIDIVCCRADPPSTVGIQATSASNMSARVKKLLATPELRTWCEAGNELWVMGWRKVKKGKRELWEPKITNLTTCWSASE